MNGIINGIQTGAKQLGRVMSKESPTILTAIGATGVILTTVMAVRATPRAMELLEEERRKRREDVENGLKFEPLSKLDVVKTAWKPYVPAGIVGAATIGCIVAANTINLRRNAALASIYTLTAEALREYQEKVIQTIGKNKEEKVRGEIDQDKLNQHPAQSSEILVTGTGQIIFYDSYSGRYFKSDYEAIRKIENNFNRDLLSDMFKPVNDLYDELGLPRVKMGDMLGWDIGSGYLDIHFDSKLAEIDGKMQPCVVLDYKLDPKLC